VKGWIYTFLVGVSVGVAVGWYAGYEAGIHEEMVMSYESETCRCTGACCEHDQR